MRGAPYVLGVVTLLNFVNYIDRYILAAVLPRIKTDFDLNDFQLGLLANAFLVAYFITAPAFGRLGDRTSRPRLIGAGVALWSLATAAAGLTRSFMQLVAARAGVGVGEEPGGIRDDLAGAATRLDCFPGRAHGVDGRSRSSTWRSRSAPRWGHLLGEECSSERSDGGRRSMPWDCQGWRWRCSR